MLSEEDIWEIAIPSNYEDSPQGYTISFARAIEAAVLAEKQEPVKDEPVGYMHPVAKKAISLADLNEQSEWIRAEWIKGAPLYATPFAKPSEVADAYTQGRNDGWEAAMLHKQEPCVCGEPSANTVHRTDGPCYQQEPDSGITFEEYAKRKPHLYGPVKDEPVAFVHRNEAGQISMKTPDGGGFDISKFVGSSLYTRPQPDGSKGLIELSPEASCLCCGQIGVPKVWAINRPTVYVCETCHRRSTVCHSDAYKTEAEGDAFTHGYFQSLEDNSPVVQPDLTAEVARLKLQSANRLIGLCKCGTEREALTAEVERLRQRCNELERLPAALFVEQGKAKVRIATLKSVVRDANKRIAALEAEVERLKLSAEHWNRLYRERCQEFHDAQANKGQEIVWLIDRIAELEALVSTREDDIRTEQMWVKRHADRIAALEEAAWQARDAFEQHDGNYKLSKASGAVVEAAIAKLDAVLGNAEVNGGRLADRPSEAV